MAAQDRKDYYYKKAKQQNYRSRAAFKLMELQTKSSILKYGDNVLEIGSSPGGWTQIIRSITERPVISVDLNDMEPIEGVYFIRGNISNPAINERIKPYMEKLHIEKFSAVLSDAMSRTSGKRDIDHSSSYLLCKRVMEISMDLLAEGGTVVVKQFQGDLTIPFLNEWSPRFRNSRITNVAASRESSSEVYIIFKGYISEHETDQFSQSPL